VPPWYEWLRSWWSSDWNEELPKHVEIHLTYNGNLHEEEGAVHSVFAEGAEHVDLWTVTNMFQGETYIFAAPDIAVAGIDLTTDMKLEITVSRCLIVLYRMKYLLIISNPYKAACFATLWQSKHWTCPLNKFTCPLNYRACFEEPCIFSTCIGFTTRPRWHGAFVRMQHIWFLSSSAKLFVTGLCCNFVFASCISILCKDVLLAWRNCNPQLNWFLTRFRRTVSYSTFDWLLY
jgi:hypothetical protein